MRLARLVCASLLAGCSAGVVKGSFGVACGDEVCDLDSACYEDRCVTLCNLSENCAEDEVCNVGLCIPGERPPPPIHCPPPEISAEATSDTALYVGFSVTAEGTVANASDECPVTPSWLVCDAPEGSSFATDDATGCVSLVDGTAATFAPDRAGVYALVFVGTGADELSRRSLTVTARTDLLFLDATFVDTEGVYNFFDASLSTDTCHVRPSDSCDGNGCAWMATPGLCWTDCSLYTSAGTCPTSVVGDKNPLCNWNGSICQPITLPLYIACYVREPASCSGLENCAYDPDLDLCGADCQAITDEDVCLGAPCVWLGDRCTRIGISSASLAPVTMNADGSAVSLLMTDAGRFRYDPNGVFSEALPGATTNPMSIGAASLPARRAAVLPYAYMFRVGDLGCGINKTLVLWQEGPTRGAPAVFEDLMPTQSSTAPTSLANFVVAATPNMVEGQSGSLNVVFGAFLDTVLPTGQVYPCTNGDFGMSSNLGSYNLIAGRAEPLWMARLEGGELTTSPLMVDAGVYPCVADEDCGAGTCDLGTSTCTGAFQVAGYLPRLQAGGDGLVFSHVTCGNYGANCSGTLVEAIPPSYRLMVGRVSESAGVFKLVEAQRLDESTLRETDAMVTGDFFGASTLYFLGRETVSTPLQTYTGPQDVDVIHTRLYRTELSYAGSWTVAPIGAPLVEAEPVPSASIFNRSYACAGAEVTRNVGVLAPMQVTLSPDGTHLGFILGQQEMTCTGGGAFRLGEPVNGALYVMDLTEETPLPKRALPDSCTPLLGAVSLMPTFIADGQQIVFASRDFFIEEDRLFRLNVADVPAAPEDAVACPLVDVGGGAETTAALHSIAANLRVTGLGLVDSRSGIGVGPACNAGGAPSLLFIAWLLFRRRRGGA